MSERILILIDGSNFYHSTSKVGIKVNFEKLIKELIGSRKLVSVNYYVAPLDINADKEKYWAHQRFLKILEGIPGFRVFLCNLKKLTVDGKGVYLVKGDDIKLSNALIMGAVNNEYDTVILISGDEDFIDSIKIVKEKYHKKVGNAYFVKTSSYNLRRACDFTVKLDKIVDKISESNEKESSALSEDHTEH
ncbi:MAG: NYN domain-containing protein [Nanoarchaeota archaeon]|nr:NYN domain-containing protein [Nanoarchaeota archaeon]